MSSSSKDKALAYAVVVPLALLVCLALFLTVTWWLELLDPELFDVWRKGGQR